MLEFIIKNNIIAIIFLVPFILSVLFLIFYHLLAFNFFIKILKKLKTNKKQILLKYKFLYEPIEEHQAIKEVFTDDDFKLFENKKLQKTRKQKIEKLKSF